MIIHEVNPEDQRRVNSRDLRIEPAKISPFVMGLFHRVFCQFMFPGYACPPELVPR